jgi:hypothetical protein
LTYRHQLALSMFLLHHVPGFTFQKKQRKNGQIVKFWCVEPNLGWKKVW